MDDEKCIGCELLATGECLKESCERMPHKTPLDSDKVSEQMLKKFNDYNAANRKEETCEQLRIIQ